MPNEPLNTKITRKSFGKIKDVVPVPNLIEIQSDSFNNFVQFDFLPSERELAGLEKVLRDVFPVEYEDKLSLEYISYELGNWSCVCGKLTGIEKRYQWTCGACKKSECSRLNKEYACHFCKKKDARYLSCSNCFSRVTAKLPMTLQECKVSGQSFSMPLKVKMQLISWDVVDNKKTVRDIKEQDIFFTDLPVMGDLYEEGGRFYLGNLGTFLINGIDRVIVSQLHRSPGVVFSQSKKSKDFRGKPYCIARIIPMRGSWIDFEFDTSDLLYVRIDKKKKLLATTFLQALGFSKEEIMTLFYSFDMIQVKNGEYVQLIEDSVIGKRIEQGMVPAAHEKKYVGRRISKELLEDLKKDAISTLFIKKEKLISRVFAKDVIDPKTGEILIEQGEAISEPHFEILDSLGSYSFPIVQTIGQSLHPTIALTLAQDKCTSQQEALKEVHSKIFPGDTSSAKEIAERFGNLLFNGKFYDLTKVGRIRMNRKLNLSTPEDHLTLTKEDIVATVKYLVNIREKGEGELDDIDHLGNRRVRLVGELLNNQMYVGFARIERIIKERFRMHEQHGAQMPQDFLNVKPLSAVLREFFGLGQLSQFMDQTNPMAELAHKRRLSALGPGGVMKDRATFEVRDVHTSHYGRICPIETSEGQTVGLISSLATHAVVNELGFIETAYRSVEDGKIKDKIVHFDAFQESDHYIAQVDAARKDGSAVEGDKILVRHNGNYEHVSADKVDYIDISPNQLVSVSAALIPFLEHDDAVRALMGANMQRQAVPLIKPAVPIVATGMEEEIVKSSGAVIVARNPGIVQYVSSEKIIVQVDEDMFTNIDSYISGGIDTYTLKKFQRSSYSTWIHHTPAVKVGDVVKKGSILTHGAAVSRGELALGRNVLVAFMPWHGYNFEDAIVLNKQLIESDAMTSVHLEEYVVEEDLKCHEG